MGLLPKKKRKEKKVAEKQEKPIVEMFFYPVMFTSEALTMKLWNLNPSYLSFTVTYNIINSHLKSHLRIITQDIIYQYITLYGLNIFFICQSHISKARGEKSL